MDYAEYLIRAKEHLRQTYDFAAIQEFDKAHETCYMCLAEIRMALHAINEVKQQLEKRKVNETV